MAVSKVSVPFQIPLLLLLSFSALLSSTTAAPTISDHFLKRDSLGPFISEHGSFPDPGVVEADGKFYAFATKSHGANVPVAVSEDFSSWELMKNPQDASKAFDAIGRFPNWVAAKNPQNPSTVWAPDVAQMQNGKYSILYCSPRKGADNAGGPGAKLPRAIGISFSSSPFGPFEPADDNELIKDDEHCGVIDPSHFTDGDCLHYVWRRQGCGGQLTSIWTQEFDIKDGQKKIGEPHMLIEAPGLGLHNIREAPYIIKSEDTYFLFYSSGYFNDDTYTVSWATRKGDLKGKFDEQGALLKTGSEESAGKKFLSPGGMTLIPVKGKQDQWHMAFHARDPPHGRPLYTATVQIKNGKPVIL